METATIDWLPDEIMSLILRNVSGHDILNFGATCKRYYEMVKNDKPLWKYTFKKFTPRGAVDIVAQSGEIDWWKETKNMLQIEKEVIAEIASMPSKYFWHENHERYLKDICHHIFQLALSHDVGYYFVTYVLQNFLIKARQNLKTFDAEPPYTLTEIYYCRCTLQHLIHTFLAMVWGKAYLTPVQVIHFFVQWMDTERLYLEEDIDNAIKEITAKVIEDLLNRRSKYPESTQPSDRQRLNAVSRVIYEQIGITVCDTTSLEVLRIPHVLKSKVANHITLAVIYHAVAQAVGVDVQFVAFPNHIFVEWTDNSPPMKAVSVLHVPSGQWRPKMQCPFGVNRDPQRIKYSPSQLLYVIQNAYERDINQERVTWSTRNALCNLGMLRRGDVDLNPYGFLSQVAANVLNGGSQPLNFKCITIDQRSVLKKVAQSVRTKRGFIRSRISRVRPSKVYYAIGMLVSHAKFGYMGVIINWDVLTDRNERQELLTRVVYQVQVIDDSVRCIDQSDVNLVASPFSKYDSIKHLEDSLGRDFSHFNGFSFVPNAEKQSEYPSDVAIADYYYHQYMTRICAPSVHGLECT